VLHRQGRARRDCAEVDATSRAQGEGARAPRLAAPNAGRRSHHAGVPALRQHARAGAAPATPQVPGPRAVAAEPGRDGWLGRDAAGHVWPLRAGEPRRAAEAAAGGPGRGRGGGRGGRAASRERERDVRGIGEREGGRGKGVGLTSGPQQGVAAAAAGGGRDLGFWGRAAARGVSQVGRAGEGRARPPAGPRGGGGG
jgi:hypothetical protein